MLKKTPSLNEVKEVFLKCYLRTQSVALQPSGLWGFHSPWQVFGTPAAHWPREGEQGRPSGPVWRMKMPDGGPGVPADLTTLSDAPRGPAPPQTVMFCEGGRKKCPHSSLPLLSSLQPAAFGQKAIQWSLAAGCHSVPIVPDPCKGCWPGP